MRRLLNWVGRGIAGLAALAVCVGLGAFATSEVMLHRSYPKPAVAIAAAGDPGAVARGRRIAVMAGCHDCHGENLTGKLFHDEPEVVRAWAPNLTLAAAQQSDVELDRAIRHGVAADGRSLWIMPSDAFAALNDAEMADLLAYLRSVPKGGAPQPRLQVGPVGRLGVLLGKFRSAPQALAAEAAVVPVDLGPQHAQGRALARSCMECHGRDLKGSEGMHSPDLTIAGAYEREDFARLLRTGIAAGDRRLGLMSTSAPARFHELTDQEIAALHEYLRARAQQPS
jgi:mono/diheme cytochrome c family protein